MQPKAIEAYSRAIRRIGNYFDCRIDNLTSDQLLDYFTELLEDHSWSTVKLDLYGLKFFYARVIDKTWEDIPLIKPPKTSRIPDILSIEQLGRLFAATNRLSYKVFFFTAYSMRLHLGEGISLTIGDIDSVNMRVHLRDAKGNKDRLVPLPDNTLHVLRNFWSMHRHPHFLFPSRKRGLKNARLAVNTLVNTFDITWGETKRFCSPRSSTNSKAAFSTDQKICPAKPEKGSTGHGAMQARAWAAYTGTMYRSQLRKDGLCSPFLRPPELVPTARIMKTGNGSRIS